jgi:hypothetical protein
MMDGMAKHAPSAMPGKSRADVWFVLLVTGGTSATLQVWHATHAGGIAPLIAALVGLVPAATAIGLSHVVASHKSARLLRVITFLVMIAAMAVSIGAVAAVVRPVEGQGFSWVFGLALDAAALACVWVLLGDTEQKAATASALETATATAEAAEVKAADAVAESSRLAAELATVSADLATANATVEALRTAAQERRPRGSAKARKGARGSGDTGDLTAELRAMQMLDAHPELRAKGMGAELARRIGVAPSTGRRLLSQLTAEERPSDAPASAAQERADDAADERS